VRQTAQRFADPAGFISVGAASCSARSVAAASAKLARTPRELPEPDEAIEPPRRWPPGARRPPAPRASARDHRKQSRSSKARARSARRARRDATARKVAAQPEHLLNESGACYRPTTPACGSRRRAHSCPCHVLGLLVW